ncbi:MAG: hypothetical protein GY820_34595, partial [Gammaproteobacteria bacterium]|nr:hypothetical protein [Gammaproteobacteria bacterium]
VEVLTHLWVALLKLKPKKCILLADKAKYLGHIVTREGLKPDPGKTECIATYPVPRNLTEMRRFIGMASYYRKFIQGFAAISHPLRKLTEKGVKFEWSSVCQEAFEELKGRLIESPLLHYPDVTKGHYYIETDGSNLGLGAVLCQKDGRGRMCPIAYASSGLSHDQQKYGPTEIEALACICVVCYFHTNIFGCEVTLLTDHNSLTFLIHQKQPIPRLQRWILTLDQYRITWVYRKGSTNAVADALSRRYRDSQESEEAQSKLIECDSLACHLPSRVLFKLCAISGGVFEIMTRSRAKQKAEISEDVPPKPPNLSTKIDEGSHTPNTKVELPTKIDKGSHTPNTKFSERLKKQSKKFDHVEGQRRFG